MKKYIYIINLCFFSILLSSCSDFLERDPYYSLNGDNAISNFEKAEAAIGGIYATTQKDSWSGLLYTNLASKSGFVNWHGENYNMSYSQLDNSFAATTAWSDFYKTINVANFAIEGITKLPAESVPGETERNALIAEARFIRAWANCNLLWNFGHWWAEDSDAFGLLYKDEVSDLGNVQMARLTVGDSYAKITEDLDYAIANLPSFTTTRYVSMEFAKVIKAKMLLYRSGYKDSSIDLDIALTLVNEVLNSSPAGFSMDPDLENVYEDSWDSTENLFAMYLEDNTSRSRVSAAYSYHTIYDGNELPLAVGATKDAGLNYGADWFTADPRWNIVTGEVRSPETWDTRTFWTWKKLTRLGRYAGKSVDEKYTAYHFRYPELYIMKSELLARTGASVADAIAPINTMRAQRTNPVISSITPANQEELMNSIFKEYFLELFLENGSEFFAATRFKSNGKRWIEVMKEGVPFIENKLCWPIPETEIISNVLMKQNPDLQ